MTDAPMEMLVAEATEVRPGDTLIVRFSDRSLSNEQVALIREHFERQIPDVHVVVLLADGLAVYRPDGQKVEAG